MPVDTENKSAPSSRRTVVEDAPGKLTARQRVRESKRARGEIACAECRRLKLRCSRTVPCSNCVRRGCAPICPNGENWSNSDHVDIDTLYRRIAQMSERIRQLEESLEILQRASSFAPHPLLREELLTIKFGADVTAAVSNSSPEQDGDEYEDEDSEFLDPLGTLTISDCGTSRFLGSTGGAESLLMSVSLVDEHDQPNIKRLIHDLPSTISETWPFTAVSLPKADLLLMIESHLPPLERAWALCEAYVENESWHLRPVDRAQIVEELFPTIYKRNDSGSDDAQPFRINPHDLALVLMVFATGAIFDLTLPPDNDEAELYHQLARTALSLQSVFDAPSLAAVQAIALMGVYLVCSGRKQTIEAASLTVNIALNLAISIGLHRDPARWKLSPKLVQRRRAVFWELYVMDGWQGLANGRPSIFSLRFVDCKRPEYDETVDDSRSTLRGYWDWKHRYSREVVYEVANRTSSSKPMKYSEALELDRKVRAFNHPVRTPPETLVLGNQGIMLAMQSFVISIKKDMVLLYIHRNFFAKALISHPADPLLSPYASSFLAAYRSSTQVLKVMSVYFGWFPSLMSRFWSFWAHGLSAAVLIGSVVTRGPHSKVAPAALAELMLAVGLFEKAEAYVPMLKRALPILTRLRRRALDAYSKYHNGHVQPITGDAHHSATSEGQEQDELSILGGQTRLLSAKNSPKPRSYQQSLPSALSSEPPKENSIDNSSPTPVPLAMDLDPETFNQYNELMSYLSSIPAAPTPAQDSPNTTSEVVSWMEESILSSPPVPLPLAPDLYPGNDAPQAMHNAVSDATFSLAAGNDPSNNLASLPRDGITGMVNDWMSFMQESGLLDPKFFDSQS